MNRAGRPLRFLTRVLGAWIGLRMVLLLAPLAWRIVQPVQADQFVDYRSLSDHGGAVPTMMLTVGGSMDVRERAGRPAELTLPTKTHAILRSDNRIAESAFGRVPIPGVAGWNAQTADVLLGASLGFVRPRLSGGVVDRLAQVVAGTEGRPGAIAAGVGIPVAPPASAPSRWSGTAWLLWRPDAPGGNVVQAPLLGGSQAGGRVDYRLNTGLSLYGRLSRALTGPSSDEGALGLAFRPGRLPISLLAERRQKLGPGGRSGFALLAAGGMGPRDVAPRLEAEGYAQAGVVGLPGFDGFADGKASLGYRLTPAGERRSLTIGGSISGSIQPGAQRLDIGPELRLRLPVGATGLRLSTEWRERIAGDARPASGPAVTLVTDF